MIEDINIKMPKSKDAVENSFRACEKRKKFVIDAEDHYKKRLRKAKHDLQSSIDEFNNKTWDWMIIKAYYALHHSANALLSKKKRLFSKDHYCLLIALKYYNLIDDDFFDELVSLSEKFSNTLNMDIAFEMRKIGQYDVDKWEKLTKEDAEKVLEIAKKFVNYVERKIQ